MLDDIFSSDSLYVNHNSISYVLWEIFFIEPAGNTSVFSSKKNYPKLGISDSLDGKYDGWSFEHEKRWLSENNLSVGYLKSNLINS